MVTDDQHPDLISPGLFLQLMLHPGCGKTSSKVKDGEHNTCNVNDSSENTISNDTGTCSNESRVSETGVNRRGSTDCWLTGYHAKECLGRSRQGRRLCSSQRRQDDR